MPGSPDGDNDLFKKPLKFVIKSPQSPDTRTAELFLSLEWQTQGTSMQKKELVVRVSDEDDPFFLYVLNLSSEAFSRLKQQQGLLVDFISFPQSFGDLLELCIQENENHDPKYVLHLNLDCKSSAQLEIVEVNRFKMLTHLSLKLSALSDESLKQYLSNCYKKIKYEKDSMERHQFEMEQQYSQRLQNTRETLKFKDDELSALRKEMQSELRKRDRKHGEEMESERQKLMKDIEEERKRMEIEVKNRELSHRKEIKELEARTSAAEQSNKELQENVTRLEKSKSDLHNKIKSLDKESKNLTKRLEMFQQQNKGLESDLKDSQAKLEKLELDLPALQQANAAKDEEISQLRQDLEILEEEKFRMEEEYRQLHNLLVECQKSENSLRKDIGTANDIIRIMQVDAKNTHDKLKDKTMILTQIETLMKEKEKQLQKSQNLIKNLESAKKENEKEIAELKESNEALRHEINLFKEKFAEEDNVLKTDGNEKLVSPVCSTRGTDKMEKIQVNSNQVNSGAKPKRPPTVHRDHGLDEKYLQRNNDLCFAAHEMNGGYNDPAPRHHNRIPVKPPVHPNQMAKAKRADPRTFQARFPRVTKQSTTVPSSCTTQHQKQTEFSSKSAQVPRK